MQEADTTHEWAEADVASFLSLRPKEGPAVTIPPTGAAAAPKTAQTETTPTNRNEGEAALYERVSVEVFAEVTAGEREGLILSVLKGGQIPPDVDGKLLTRAAKAIGAILQPGQKRSLRQAFRKTCERPPE